MPDIQGVIDSALSVMGGLLWGSFGAIAYFLIDYLPDADTGMLASINALGSALSGEGLTFNVMYFIDFPLVAAFLSMTVIVVAACYLTMMIRTVLDTITRLVGFIFDTISMMENAAIYVHGLFDFFVSIFGKKLKT